VVPGVVLAAGVGVGLAVGIVLVVPAPAPLVIPVLPVVPGVVLGVVTVDGHGLLLRVDVAVPLVVPVVPAVALGDVVVPVVPAVVPGPTPGAEVPSVALDPVPVPVEGVHGLSTCGDGVEGDVVVVLMPVCDWVPTVCAANPIESVRIANVSHFVRILSS
jgi:hypothetical protein